MFALTPAELERRVNAIATMARDTFTRETVGGTCIICPEKPRDEILEITWTAKWKKPPTVEKVLVDLAVEAVADSITGPRDPYRTRHYNGDYVVVTFDTFHPISSEGLKILKKHRLVSSITRGICTLFTVAASVSLALGIVAILLEMSSPLNDPDHASRTGWYMAVGGLIVLIPAILYGMRARAYGLPTAALQKIAQSPIEFDRWTTVA